jgi:phenylacetate-coenzyme A ligase PaaK-like adenylate-forming protein
MKTHDPKIFNELTKHHKRNCKVYSDYVDSMFDDCPKSLKDIPYLPVRAFKEFDLYSVPEQDIFKTMYSSGTTGKRSKIFLDKDTVKTQSLHLAQSFKSYFGGSRFPMLIIDSQSTSRGQTARTAAVNGFSMYGRKRCFALDDDMELKVEEVIQFLETHKGTKIFVFGFTFILYQFFIKKLQALNLKLDLSNAFILHGGGWKKLVSLNISDQDFKAMIKSSVGCEHVHNYYGMIEQTGSIYFECEYGHLHAPHNGAVLIRNVDTLEINEYGKEGLIQVFSSIQKSYPGHSLLTEDIGVARPASDCPCGREGDILEIHGRLEQAEIRGCSDAV